MADKFRKTAPIKITFAQSEQPSAEKMSALSIQARNGLKLIEKAVGDIWNQSGDSLLHDYPLQIPNLARILGEQKYLNPAIYPLQSVFKYRDMVGYRYRGYTYGYLTFKPKSGSTFAFYNTTGQFTTLCTNEYDVDATGEYWIGSNGKWRTNDELLASNEQVEYQVDAVTDYPASAQVFPSVIPDPRHFSSKFSGCRLTKVSGHYYLYLPPRRPLDFTGTDYQDNKYRPAKYPADADIGLDRGNEATTLDTNNLRYWQSDTVDAMDHGHYRYSLPREILGAHSTMSLGTEYPANALYLWDQADSTVLEGIVFRKPYDIAYTSKPWVIEISSSNTEINLDDYLSSPDNESEAAYSSTGLTLIACGASVSRSLWLLMSQFLNHEHNNFGQDSLIRHYRIQHVNPPKDSVYTHNGRYPSNIPAWPQSRYLSDDHTYLLSRTGSQGVSTRHRDENDNVMLGNFVLANSVADAGGVFLNDTCANSSFKLVFGSNAGPYIRGETNSAIHLVPGTGGVLFSKLVPDASPFVLGPITASTATHVDFGGNSSGDRSAQLDFIASGSGSAQDYDLRLLRNSGANGTAQLINKGTGVVFIESAGGLFRVGNTTASGATHLDLGGNAPSGDRDVYLDMVASGALVAQDWDFTIRRYAGANGDLDMANKGSGKFYIGAYSGNFVIHGSGGLDTTIDIGHTSSANINTALHFHASASTDYNARIIRASGINGILTIENTGTGSVYLQYAPTTASVLVQSTADTTVGRLYLGLSSYLQRATGTDGIFSIGNTGAGGITVETISSAPIIFKTQNTQRVRIETGITSVGIGSVNPETALDVNCSGPRIYVRSTAAEQDAWVRIGYGGAGSTWRGAYLDLVSESTTYPEYGLRLVRNSGVNNYGGIYWRGTGAFNIQCEEYAYTSWSRVGSNAYWDFSAKTATGISYHTLGSGGSGDRAGHYRIVASDLHVGSYSFKIERLAGADGACNIRNKGTGIFGLNAETSGGYMTLGSGGIVNMTVGGGLQTQGQTDIAIGQSQPMALTTVFLASPRILHIQPRYSYGPALIKLGNDTALQGNGVIEVGTCGYLSGDNNEWTATFGVNLVTQYNGTSTVYITPKTTTGYGYRGISMNYNGSIRFFQSTDSTTAGAVITPTQVLEITTSVISPSLSIIPSSTDSFDLGSSSLRWNDVCSNHLDVYEVDTSASLYTNSVILAEVTNTAGGATWKQGLVCTAKFNPSAAAGTFNQFTAGTFQTLFTAAYTGTITDAIGVKATVSSSGAAAGAITNAYGVYVSIDKSGSTTMGTAYGVRVFNITAATNNYAIATSSGKVALYDRVSMGVSAGSAVSSNAALHVIGNPIVIGPSQVNSGDASLHIHGIYGGNDRMTQMNRDNNNNGQAINIIASKDSNTDRWWSWGVESNVWKTQPGSSFASTGGFRIDSSGNARIANTLCVGDTGAYDAENTAPLHALVTTGWPGRGMIWENNINNALGSYLSIRKSQGSHASKTTIATTSHIGTLEWQGWNSNSGNWETGAYIQVNADGAGNSSGDMPMKMWFATASDGTSGGTTRLTIPKDGGIIIADNASLPAGSIGHLFSYNGKLRFYDGIGAGYGWRDVVTAGEYAYYSFFTTIAGAFKATSGSPTYDVSRSAVGMAAGSGFQAMDIIPLHLPSSGVLGQIYVRFWHDGSSPGGGVFTFDIYCHNAGDDVYSASTLFRTATHTVTAGDAGGSHTLSIYAGGRTINPGDVFVLAINKGTNANQVLSYWSYVECTVRSFDPRSTGA